MSASTPIVRMPIVRPFRIFTLALAWQWLTLAILLLTIWATRSSGPILFLYAASFVWLQWMLIRKKQILPNPENACLLVASLFITGMAISGGAFLSTTIRFAWSMAWFGTFFVLIGRRKQSLPWNLFRYTYAASAYLVLMAGSGLVRGSALFYPIQWVPLILIPVVLMITRFTRKWYWRLWLIFMYTGILTAWGFPGYLAAMSGKKMQGESVPAFNQTVYDEQTRPLIPAKTWKGRVVVLEFWHSRCGACFQAFPAWEAFSQRYRHNPNLMIAAVNVPLPSDTAGQHLAMTHAYHFRKLALQDLQDADAWGITQYPTVLLIDQQGKLRYKGLAHFESPVFSLDRMLQDLLKNS